MTATSELGYYHRFPRKRFGGDDPLSVAAARNAVGNNLTHLADEALQHRVGFNAITTALRATVSPSTGSTYTHIRSFGPFPVTVGAGGLPVPLSVRVAGSISANAGDFRVIVASEKEHLVSTDRYPWPVFDFSVSSTTDKWLTGVSQAIDRPGLVRASDFQPVQTITIEGGGSTSALWYLATAHVFGLADTASDTLRMSSLLIREYAV